MIALLSLIYSSFYLLFFKKLKLFAESVRNISIFVGIGVVLIGAIVYAWWTFAPTSADGRAFQYVIPIVPNVAGQVVEVPIEGTQRLKKGDVLFRIDPTPYQFTVDQLKASVDQAVAQKKLAEIEVERATGLVRASAGAQSQLDQWNAQLASTVASIASLTAQLGIIELFCRWRLRRNGESVKIITPGPLVAIFVGLSLAVSLFLWGQGEGAYVIFLSGYRKFFGAGI